MSLAGRGDRLRPIGEVIGPQDRGAADFHFLSQALETFPGLPSSVYLRSGLVILRQLELTGAALRATTNVDAHGRPFAGAVQVESVADNPRSNAEGS